jgi:hypothetical protein
MAYFCDKCKIRLTKKKTTKKVIEGNKMIVTKTIVYKCQNKCELKNITHLNHHDDYKE